MKFFNKILIVALIVGFSACDVLEFDLQENPNSVTAENASVNDLYNSIQLNFAQFFQSSYTFTAGMARMRADGGAYDYQNAYTPESFNGLWFQYYSTLLPDIDALLNLAEPLGLDIHTSSAKIMKAYATMIMVDIFADIPYSDALQGAANLSPGIQEGASVYTAAEALIAEAITSLSSTTAAAPNDNLFNSGSAAAWLKAAKTLQLRTALTKRLVDPAGSTATINALVAEGDIITTSSEDFQFNLGNQRTNPNSRHPFYNEHYESGDGGYMSNYYMWLLRAEKQTPEGDALIDPRIRFYFHRQTGDAAGQNGNTYSCHFTDFPDQDAKPAHYNDIDPRLPYCIASEDGYWGRDHLNNEGIPPDGNLRTIYGLYPGGGAFDDGRFAEGQQEGTTGALGEGIVPMMLSSFVDFMRAEAALTLGTTDDAREMLKSGIEASLDKVMAFADRQNLAYVIARDIDGNEVLAESLLPADSTLTEYVDFVMAQYDAATDDDTRLDIISKEYYIALFGNGIDAYNLYRRTGKPNNMAPSLEPGPGPFIRSAFLPAVHVNRNASTSSNKPLTQQVFWDTNPADFVY